MVAAAFALDPLAHVDEDIGIRLFNKTGTQRGTRADVGCLEAGEWVATYAVIGRFDDSAPARLAVLDAMRAVGTVLLEMMAEMGGSAWKPEYTSAWAEAYQVVQDIMLKGAEQ